MLESRLRRLERTLRPQPARLEDMTDAELAAIAGVSLDAPDLDEQLERIVAKGRESMPNPPQPCQPGEGRP